MHTGTHTVKTSDLPTGDNLPAFIDQMFTKREAEYFALLENPILCIAKAYAAKNAFFKYLGKDVKGFGFRDIEFMNYESEKPYILLMKNETNLSLSIDIQDDYAFATVWGEDTGITDENIENLKSYHHLLPKRISHINKSDCGRLFVIAGSKCMVGAAELCASSAMRSGSGLVTVATSKSVQPYLSVKLTEAMTLPLEDKDGIISYAAISDIMDNVKKSDVTAIGSGLGKSEDIILILKDILSCKKPCVIDADGLNALSCDTSVLLSKNCETVLTPHPGEMSRLTGISVADIQKNRVEIALEYAKKFNSVIVLKGKNTVIASPNGEYHINTTGNNGMASGGMGDVLTGIIASFMGQGLPPFNAALLGTFIHGLSADIAVCKTGVFGLIASDVVNNIPKAIQRLQYII